MHARAHTRAHACTQNTPDTTERIYLRKQYRLPQQTNRVGTDITRLRFILMSSSWHFKWGHVNTCRLAIMKKIFNDNDMLLQDEQN